MSTKTVNLAALPQAASTKLLADVQRGKMTMAEYQKQLEQKHQIRGEWSPHGETFTLNLGSGLKDPSGEWLTADEYIEVLKSLLPSPLQLAGKQLDLVGPLMGAGGMVVVRAWYATKVRLGTISRATGLIDWQNITPIETYRVKLRSPDTNERETRKEGNQVWCRTSQLKYKRFIGKPPFDYTGELQVNFEPNSPWHPGRVIAQVRDQHNNFAWIDDLRQLEDT